jgi:hypothetical protein
MNLSKEDREVIREAVTMAIDLWPNGHLGAHSRREDMRSAFVTLRHRITFKNMHPQAAATMLMVDAERYRDM